MTKQLEWKEKVNCMLEYTAIMAMMDVLLSSLLIENDEIQKEAIKMLKTTAEMRLHQYSNGTLQIQQQAVKDVCDELLRTVND